MILAQWSDSDLQNYKIVHLYGFKLLSLWQSVIAAIGHRFMILLAQETVHIALGCSERGSQD